MPTPFRDDLAYSIFPEPLRILPILFKFPSYDCENSVPITPSIPINKPENSMSLNEFSIKRGTNISEVFISTYLSDHDRDQFFNIRDIKQISRMGLDHIRIPISEEVMWTHKGKQIVKQFERLERAISDSIDNKLNVILCVHGLRSHPIPGKGVPTLFKSVKKVKEFRKKWLELSNLFGHFPVKNLAYEILNEPRAPSDQDWNQVLKKIYLSIREKEPKRTLLFGSNFYQVPERIKTLVLPDNDPNIIRTFHLYYPFLLTHYKANWLRNGEYEGPIQYPGRPIPNEYTKDLIEPLGSHMGQNNNPVSKIVFAKVLRDAAKAIGATSHPIHCGEFGCIDTVPIEARKLWYSDVVECLQTDGIPWTNWDWKGNFGILDQETWRPSGIQHPMGLNTPKWSSAQKPHLSLKSKIRRRLGRYARRLGLRRSRIRVLFFRKP